MPSRKKARLAFASALALLLICGAATTVTIGQLIKSAKWIAHTYDVQVSLGDVQTAFSAAARARTNYLNSGDTAYLPEYDGAKTQVHRAIARIRELTKDNSMQGAAANRLEDLMLRRLELLDTSVEIRKTGPLDEMTQLRLSRENVAATTDFMDVVESMMQAERGLLAQRRAISGNLLTELLGILLGTLALAILLFWVHYRLLEGELVERERMEDSARRLSGRILQLQDEERRRFSRELHDSLGQLLAMAKMHLYELQEKTPHDESVVQIDKLLDQSISETRTISHLLHPPLLDEVGLASAFRWYVEGFAQRSGIKVNVEIAEDVHRLSRPVELALFRVLQESLTNIHRHSKSPRAEVSLRQNANGTTLKIRDFGKGIAPDTLRSFLQSGSRVGVGLAGMRERVREQSGQLAVQSDTTGTTITVTMPNTPVIAPDSREVEASAPAD
jgi:signal transduction histidine kinase